MMSFAADDTCSIGATAFDPLSSSLDGVSDLFDDTLDTFNGVSDLFDDTSSTESKQRGRDNNAQVRRLSLQTDNLSFLLYSTEKTFSPAIAIATPTISTIYVLDR